MSDCVNVNKRASPSETAYGGPSICDLLPGDIFVNILCNIVSDIDLCNAIRCCKAFHEASKRREVWTGRRHKFVMTKRGMDSYLGSLAAKYATMSETFIFNPDYMSSREWEIYRPKIWELGQRREQEIIEASKRR